LNASDFFADNFLFSPPISSSCDCADAEVGGERERVKKLKRANEKKEKILGAFFLLFFRLSHHV
jgi:hypothetical protein